MAKYTDKTESIKNILKEAINFKLEKLELFLFEIERKFESDKTELSQRRENDIKREMRDPETQSLFDELYYEDEFYTIENIFLKTFRYSAIVTIYSLLENSMNTLCEILRKLKKLSLSFADLHGNGIKRAKLYLQKVCLIDFPESTHEWSQIQSINIIRNCIIHVEGNIHSAKNSQKLRDIISQTRGLTLKGDTFIAVELWFIKESIKNVKSFLEKLYDQSF